MALNLLDSLSVSSAPSEKNAFSSKSKTDGDAGTTDFGQMLHELMPDLTLKGLGLTPGDAAASSGKDPAAGQELATGDSDAKDALTAPDGTLLLTPDLMPAVPQHLSAWVLSPNMTAITASPSAPDSGSLSAFAKSQGLDEDVATWLLTAGQGTSANDKMTLPAADPAAGMASGSLPTAALALDSLHAGLQGVGSMVISSAPAEETATVSMPILPVAMPATWWTQRLQGAGKTATSASAPTAPGTGKSTAHTSELDLSLVFADTPDGANNASTGSASLPFTPAAWLMPGGTPANDAEASSLVKVLAHVPDSDSGSDRVDGSTAVSPERSPTAGKPAETTLASTTKAFESSLTAAQRSEAQQAQAEKMGQAIGQRMLSEMEKGHWHLKMMLRPANLGHIEVEMRLRNGELDAHFTASQASTRDLLQDGLPKLKDTLTQMGMDVANMNIGGGSSQKNGGDSTPGQRQFSNNAKDNASGDAHVLSPESAPRPRRADGWDVMV